MEKPELWSVDFKGKATLYIHYYRGHCQMYVDDAAEPVLISNRAFNSVIKSMETVGLKVTQL